MCRWTRIAPAVVSFTLILACAAPQTAPPPPVLAPGIELPAPAEEMDYYPIVSKDAGVAKATAALAKASPKDRPKALMSRARVAYAAAVKIRTEKGGPIGFFGWSLERERFIAFCELGLRDLDEILLAYPESPEAPEAMYTVGQIEDYPNLNHFEDALETYRKTVSAYPGTDWARLAAERVKVIEEIIGGKSAPK